jgi:hypothetical protein
LNERPPLSICIAVRSWVPEFLRDLMLIEPVKKPLTKLTKNLKGSKEAT